jgi:hypothetical protein
MTISYATLKQAEEAKELIRKALSNVVNVVVPSS